MDNFALGFPGNKVKNLSVLIYIGHSLGLTQYLIEYQRPRQKQRKKKRKKRGRHTYIKYISENMGYLVISPEYVPYVSTIANFIISFTPLLSYGSTVLSIRKRQSSQGFSIDICGTMLVSSILRIFYYFNDPFEVTLLRQCFVMVFIQTILLRTALKYRSEDAVHFEKYDGHWDSFYNKVLELNKEQIDNTFEKYEIGDQYNNYNIQNIIVGIFVALFRLAYINGVLTVSAAFKLLRDVVSLFDYHYIRPFNYWQWKEPITFWKFLLGFVVCAGIIQITFNGNEYLGICFGSISFLVESSLPLPQILLFQRVQNVENFKIILLLSWLGGDITKISYLLFGTENVGLLFIFAAFFQMSLNFVITYQFFYYKFNPNLNREHIMTHIPLSHAPVNIRPPPRSSTLAYISRPSINETNIIPQSRASSISFSGIIPTNSNVNIVQQNQHYQSHRKSISLIEEDDGIDIAEGVKMNIDYTLEDVNDCDEENEGNNENETLLNTQQQQLPFEKGVDPLVEQVRSRTGTIGHA